MTDEGYTKFHCQWIQAPPIQANLIEKLNRSRQRLYRASLIGYYPDLKLSYGNLSVRAAESCEFLITGTQTGSMQSLSGDHYTWVTGYDIDANNITCRGPIQASSETLTHAAIYELDEAFRAVVHAHDKFLWNRLRHAVPTTRDDVFYGTPDMARELRRIYLETDLRQRRLAVMGGHDAGLISLGANIAEAAERLLKEL